MKKKSTLTEKNISSNQLFSSFSKVKSNGTRQY